MATYPIRHLAIKEGGSVESTNRLNDLEVQVLKLYIDRRRRKMEKKFGNKRIILLLI